jgi:hypothetical protein
MRCQKGSTDLGIGRWTIERNSIQAIVTGFAKGNAHPASTAYAWSPNIIISPFSRLQVIPSSGTVSPPSQKSPQSKKFA